MKIVITHTYYIAQDIKEQKIMMPYPPLGLLYVSAYLEQQGFPNQVFDSTFESEDALCQYLKNEQPDVVCIYANMINKPNVVRMMQFIKSAQGLPHAHIILGGPDIRYNAENYLKHGADYLVIGEGEATAYELIKNLSEKTATDQVRGIAFLRNGELVITPDRRFANIDELPFPARDKINLNRYIETWKNAHGQSSLNINTMRGCPFWCKWCSTAVYGNSYRRRSAKLVADEIQWLQQQYRFDNIWFVDDVFTVNKRWLGEFAEEIKNRNITIRYECITRADRLGADDILLLKQSGCYRVWIGAESGSQKIIDLMNRRVRIEDVQRALIEAKKAGIMTGTFIMLGYPGEDETDIEATVKHLKKTDPDFFTITLAYPITGTELYYDVTIETPKDKTWKEVVDRELNFKRTYTIDYYKYALRYVQNEMAWFKAIRKHGTSIASTKLKLKSVYAKIRMKLIRQFNKSEK